MIKIHEIEKAVKLICKNSFDLDKFNKEKADKKIVEYLEKIKENYHHIEYEVNDSYVKLLLYTSDDDGFDLSFKMTVKDITPL